jgi:hypothetical protein
MDRLLWTQILDMGPPLRNSHSTAYDSDRDRIVLMDGFVQGMNAKNVVAQLPAGDTWEFDGAIWIQTADMGPSPRFNHGSCYDSGRKRTVLYGGRSETNGDLRDTWEWDGQVWTQVADGGPTGGPAYSFCYDAKNGYSLLLSGPQAGSDLITTWSWDGTEWTELDDSGPGSDYGLMAYDAVGQQVILCPASSVQPDTYAWTGSAWKQVADMGVEIELDTQSMCFDGKEVIIYGPESTQTWSWTGTAWVQRQDIGPVLISGFSVAGDTRRQQCVLTGGRQALMVPETWVLRRIAMPESQTPPVTTNASTNKKSSKKKKATAT